jgi:hypothetical protein
MHEGVATVPAVGVALDEGVGELREVEGLRPVHAAKIAPKPSMRAMRREIMLSNKFTSVQSCGRELCCVWKAPEDSLRNRHPVDSDR